MCGHHLNSARETLINSFVSDEVPPRIFAGRPENFANMRRLARVAFALCFA
jgi:hypothetical protein